MSHLTRIKTRFQNLFHLEKVLNKLNIVHQQQTLDNSKNYGVSLIIPQLNGHNVAFSFNDQEYELVLDRSFWEQSYRIENFIDKISQQYAGEVIIGESQKIGFQPIKYQSNSDSSNKVVLERWNNIINLKGY